MLFKRLIASIVSLAFIFSNFQYVHAQDFSINQLPVPGSMVAPAVDFMPLTLKGLVIHPENALKFDFLMDTGNSHLNGQPLKDEALKVMKYFLTALTMPEDDMWVNLSPYEKGRIVENNFGSTLMGRDLLAEDYVLKQLTASLIYPEDALGKKFWTEVYQKAQTRLGTTQIPVNTFNKVWIVPSEAVVWEHDGKVMIVKSHLKVMLEEDYLSLQKHSGLATRGLCHHESLNECDTPGKHSIGSQAVREIVLPVLEKQVNEGEHFAQLRQMYQAMILATWYKKALRESIITKVYANQKKIKGVDNVNTSDIASIYQQYLKAFKKGAFNYIKEDIDPATGQTVPRKYFSGGFSPLVNGKTSLDVAEDVWKGDAAQLSGDQQVAIYQALNNVGTTVLVEGNVSEVGPVEQNTKDKAMLSSASLGNFKFRAGLMNYHFFAKGAIDRIMQDQIDLLNHYGIAADVLTGSTDISSSSDLKIEQLPSLRLPEDRPAMTDIEQKDQILEKLREWVKDKDVVIVHNMLALPDVSRPFIEAFKELMNEMTPQERRKRKFIAWIHDSKEPVDYIDGVQYIAISSVTKNNLERNLRFTNGRQEAVSEVPNAIHFRRFLQISPMVEDFFVKHHLWEADNIMLYPTRLSHTKNIERAIRIVDFLKKNRKQKIKLVIVTAPRFSYEPGYYGQLKDLISQLGLKDDVLFTFEEQRNGKPWVLTDEELKQFYQYSDALLSTSVLEGFDLPVIEGAVLKLPAIVLDIPPQNKLLEGSLVLNPTGSLDEDANKIINYLHNPISNNYKQVRKDYNLEKKWEESILSILGFNVAYPFVGAQTSRHAPSSQWRIEDQLEEAIRQKFPVFEIFFDGYGPAQILNRSKEELKSRAADANVRLYVNISLSDIMTPDGQEEISNAIDFTSDIGAEVLTIRVGAGEDGPGLVNILKNMLKKVKQRNIMKTALKKALEKAARRGVKIALENGVGVSAETMSGILEKLQEYKENVGLSFSIGNANLSGSPSEYLARLKGPIINVHLSDNDGQKDEHWRIGGGNIDFKTLLPFVLRKTRTETPLIIERWDGKEKDAEFVRYWAKNVQKSNDHAMIVETLDRLAHHSASFPVPDIERTFKEGDIDNHLVRYVKDKVTAHIAVSGQPTKEPEIIIAMPFKNSESAFYWKASSDQGDFQWSEGQISPVIDGNYRGVNAEFSTEKTSINLNFADKSNLILNHIVNLRMRIFYNQWPYNNVPEQEEKLMSHILQLSPEHQKELEKEIGAPLSEIIIPKVNVKRQDDGSHVIEVVKTTFDGEHHYRLRLEVPPGFTVDNNNGSIKINGPRPVELFVRATTDFEPLTPLPMEEIFNKETLDEMRGNPEFDKIAQNFAALFYEEKLLAGAWVYFAHFGRDTLIGARLMWSALTLKAKGMIVRSILDRISDDGRVAVNDETVQERLFQISVTRKFNEERDHGGNPDVLGMFRTVLKNAKRENLVYDVLDNTFLFPGIEKRLFDDLDNDNLLNDFLNSPNARGENNIETVLRNWDRILELTDFYTQGMRELRKEYPAKTMKELTGLDEFRGLTSRLIRKVPGASHTNWRDSSYALGWGEYAADINLSLAPNSIEGIAAMIKLLNERGINIQKLVEEKGFKKLQEYLAENAVKLDDAREAWSTAIEHFKTHLSPEEVRAKLGDYFRRSTISQKKKQALLQMIISKDEETPVTVQGFLNGKTPLWLKDGFSFTNIAWDKKIIHSDETYSLLDKDLDSKELNRILDELFAPWPIGLWNDDVGLFVANAIFTGDENIWREFDRKGAYHGHDVWSNSMRELKLGLIRQIRNAEKRENYQDLKRLENALMRVIRTEEKVGDLGLSEVWTWEPAEDGHMKAVAFLMGEERGQPSGNPQLWASSDAEQQPPYKTTSSVMTWEDTLSPDDRQYIFSGSGADPYVNPDTRDKKYLEFRGLNALAQAIEQKADMTMPLKNGLLPWVRYMLNGRNGSENNPLILAMLGSIEKDRSNLPKMEREFAEAITSLTAYDRAMLQTPKIAPEANPLGGITLNSGMLDLQIKRDGNGVPLPISQQPLDKINIRGFVPVIIDIRTVNLPELFGFNT
jgi:sugar phosphate isomerase/epimerase